MKFSDLKKNIADQEGLGNEASSEKIKNLGIILDIVNSINGSLILEDVLELVLKSSIKLTNSERGFIVLKNTDSNLEYKMGLDSDNNLLDESSFNVSTTVVEDVFSTGQSKFIEGAQSDTNYDPSKSILKLELQTILCSPLITGDKKIGVVYVDSRYLQKIKIKELTDTFEILAGQAATAIRNAQLYNGQVKAFNALQEANSQLIHAERRALKAGIDSEIGQSLQGLVHLALLESESLLRTIEKSEKEYEQKGKLSDSIFFDRLKLKSKVSIDSVRNIQKYAQLLVETSLMNINKDSGDLNVTIQNVIKYLSPMKKFQNITFKTELNNLPEIVFDSEQIQNLLVHLFTNAADAKYNTSVTVRTWFRDNKVYAEILDTGPGIPLEILNSIFELPTQHKPGYGLFLCKNIIDRHNGEISITNKPVGVRVEFTLPL